MVWLLEWILGQGNILTWDEFSFYIIMMYRIEGMLFNNGDQHSIPGCMLMMTLWPKYNTKVVLPHFVVFPLLQSPFDHCIARYNVCNGKKYFRRVALYISVGLISQYESPYTFWSLFLPRDENRKQFFLKVSPSCTFLDIHTVYGGLWLGSFYFLLSK